MTPISESFLSLVRDAQEKQVTDQERRDFTITKLERNSEEGFWQARVSNGSGLPLYVDRRFGSWLVFGEDQEALNRFKGIRELRRDVIEALQMKVRANERAEGREERER